MFLSRKPYPVRPRHPKNANARPHWQKKSARWVPENAHELCLLAVFIYTYLEDPDNQQRMHIADGNTHNFLVNTFEPAVINAFVAQQTAIQEPYPANETRLLIAVRPLSSTDEFILS